jgi:hypothetical protein
LKGEINGEESSVTGGDFSQRWVMTGGSHLSAGERKDPVSVQEIGKWAAGLFLCWAETVPLALFHFIFFSFSFLFCFLIFFISFAFDVQMTSNQLQIFSKIQRNKLG